MKGWPAVLAMTALVSPMLGVCGSSVCPWSKESIESDRMQVEVSVQPAIPVEDGVAAGVPSLRGERVAVVGAEQPRYSFSISARRSSSVHSM